MIRGWARWLALMPLLLLQALAGHYGPPPTPLQDCQPQTTSVTITQTISRHVTQTSFQTLVQYESTVSTEWLTETEMVTQVVTQTQLGARVTQTVEGGVTTTTVTHPHYVTLSPRCTPITGYGGKGQNNYQG